MRARPLTALLTALCLLSTLGACGGSSSSPTDVVKSYLKALGSGDYATACADIASSTRTVIERASRGKRCDQALRAALTASSAHAVQALKSGQVGQARTSGNAGTVPVSVRGVGSVPIQVTKEGGAWKVARATGG